MKEFLISINNSMDVSGNNENNILDATLAPIPFAHFDLDELLELEIHDIYFSKGTAAYVGSIELAIEESDLRNMGPDPVRSDYITLRQYRVTKPYPAKLDKVVLRFKLSKPSLTFKLRVVNFNDDVPIGFGVDDVNWNLTMSIRPVR